MAGGKGGCRIGYKGRSSFNQGRIRKDGYSRYEPGTFKVKGKGHVCSATEQGNRVDRQRTMGFAKEETIGKAAAQLFQNIMPAAIAEAMKDVRRMLGKGRWVRAESDEEPKEGTIGEKTINDEGLGYPSK
ncbi:hypothetical protein L1987_26183 [Smallanthus sonchifolius]|uniref:Uncharacterized protein n=1 Tax=Smallanthus sonchifolius TaxID=185202 RepID=A0ACB9IAL3_9ASTR|nr:hypothetical protein L1987_26183 [Smallanthus sonchifolius]